MKLAFKKDIYPPMAIQHTCNLFSDIIIFEIEEKGKDVFVKIFPKENTSQSSMEKIIGDFKNELIHQALRLKIAKDNKKIRGLLIEQALSAAMPRKESEGTLEAAISEEDIDKELEEILKEVETETQNYQDDPLGIAVPWEEKYQEKGK